KEDEFKLCIPKGHYEVKFIPQKKQNASNQIAKWRKATLILFGFSIGLTALMFYFALKSQQLSDEINGSKLVDRNNPIWSTFLQGDLPTLIVNGDNYFFSMFDPTTNQNLIVRNSRINSNLDLDLFLEDHTHMAGQIQKGDFAFLGKESAWSLLKLFPIFFSFQRDIELTLASQLAWEDFQKHHIIYLGSYKALGILNSLLTNTTIQHQLYPHNITIKPDSTRVFSPELTLDQNHEKNFNKDYALCAKLPGPNNNAVLIVAGFYFIGVHEAIKQLCDPELRLLLEEYLIKQHNHVPEYFELLMEISGFRRTGFSTTIIYSAEIDPDF
ncbi:MAG: hypothetical protein JW902_07305, partial [Syntrophaceae bacterium]|nr:hypothetical protein [Syntrophaceae bacterium]